MRFTLTVSAVVLFLVMALSCSEPITPSVRDRLAPIPLNPVRTLQSAPVFSNVLDASEGSTLTLPTYDVPEGVLVDLTIAGSVTFWSHSYASPYHFDGALDAKGLRVENDPGCLATTKIVYSQISGAANPFPNTLGCLIPRTMSDYTVRALVGGTGVATRGPLPRGNTYPCDSIRAAGDQCYAVDGEQTITVAPVPAALDFEGTYSGVRSHSLFVAPFVTKDGVVGTGYSTVIFTDSTIPRGMPLKNLSHTWIFADPSDPGDSWWHKTENTCYAGNILCSVNVKETGTMISKTRVNFVDQYDSVVVYCKADSILLDADEVRQALLKLLDSSNAQDSNFLNRTERTFLIVKDTVAPGAKPYIIIQPADPFADVCGTSQSLDPSFLPPNTRVLAVGHSHPSEPNRIVLCEDGAGHFEVDSAGHPKLSKTSDGADLVDRAAADSLNSSTANATYHSLGWLPMLMFIIDKHFVFTLRPGEKLGDEHNAGNKFPHGQGRCKWPKRA